MTDTYIILFVTDVLYMYFHVFYFCYISYFLHLRFNLYISVIFKFFLQFISRILKSHGYFISPIVYVALRSKLMSRGVGYVNVFNFVTKTRIVAYFVFNRIIFDITVLNLVKILAKFEDELINIYC